MILVVTEGTESALRASGDGLFKDVASSVNHLVSRDNVYRQI